jgi:hypothetical protein
MNKIKMVMNKEIRYFDLSFLVLIIKNGRIIIGMIVSFCIRHIPMTIPNNIGRYLFVSSLWIYHIRTHTNNATKGGIKPSDTIKVI